MAQPDRTLQTPWGPCPRAEPSAQWQLLALAAVPDRASAAGKVSRKCPSGSPRSATVWCHSEMDDPAPSAVAPVPGVGCGQTELYGQDPEAHSSRSRTSGPRRPGLSPPSQSLPLSGAGLACPSRALGPEDTGHTRPAPACRFSLASAGAGHSGAGLGWPQTRRVVDAHVSSWWGRPIWTERSGLRGLRPGTSLCDRKESMGPGPVPREVSHSTGLRGHFRPTQEPCCEDLPALATRRGQIGHLGQDGDLTDRKFGCETVGGGRRRPVPGS